ncbi:helix-turn-helix domain-containing protein [Bradyrhizobium genosp. SA-3]|uniref:helix-turn-helix domain-containing protein n=1 Tax=Bradyrhizobium genosp. SA-3 TaxID=508868 RepID=UPI00102A9975|nr:helix-turn-helix domain-containing protein [Bradyrhizobium genosp. SA-3]
MSLFGDQTVRRDTGIGTLLMVGAAVVVGHAEARPMNATKISLYVNLPRSTVQRKLDQLQQLGVIVRRGNAYCLSPSRAGNIPPEYVKRSARIITEAAKRLTREV